MHHWVWVWGGEKDDCCVACCVCVMEINRGSRCALGGLAGCVPRGCCCRRSDIGSGAGLTPRRGYAAGALRRRGAAPRFPRSGIVAARGHARL